jgi:hypothetical protein
MLIKTEQEIRELADRLDKKRIGSLIDRDNSKIETERSVNQNLVLIYVMQHQILMEILNERN